MYRTLRRESRLQPTLGGISTSTNLETARAIHAAFNAREWGSLQACFADGCIFIDGRGHNHIGAGEVVAGYAKPWVEAFSDGQIVQDIYYDAGDTVVAEFTGKVNFGRAYFDQLSLLQQLGYA
jgi:SnoaL-like protein